MVRPDDAFDETPVYVTVSAFMVAPHCPTTVKVYAICVTSYTHLCLRSFLVLGRSTGFWQEFKECAVPAVAASRQKQRSSSFTKILTVQCASLTSQASHGTMGLILLCVCVMYVRTFMCFYHTYGLDYYDSLLCIFDYYTCFVLFSEFFWYNPRRQVSRSICKCRLFDWNSCSFYQRHGYEKVATTVCSMELINLWNEPIKMCLPTPTLFPKVTSTSRLDSGLSRGNRLTTRIALSFIKLASREHPQQIYIAIKLSDGMIEAWQCSDLGDWQGPFARLNQPSSNQEEFDFARTIQTTVVFLIWPLQWGTRNLAIQSPGVWMRWSTWNSLSFIRFRECSRTIVVQNFANTKIQDNQVRTFGRYH